jgi:hypothetical protein
MSELESLDELTRALLPVAGDPREVARLYGLLREFCHTFRNRLNCLKLSLYLAERQARGGETFTELTRRYSDVEQFVDRVQAICRPLRLLPMRVSMGTVLEERRAAWTAWLSARSRSLEWGPPPEDPPTILDGVQLAHALDSLVAWRAQQGREGDPVRLGWRTISGELSLVWEERGLTALRPAPGSVPNLALPLLARVVSAHGGRVLVSDQDGFRIEVWLPAEFDPQAEWSADAAWPAATGGAAAPVGDTVADLNGAPRANGRGRP